LDSIADDYHKNVTSATSGAELRISLLGSFQVTRGDEPLTRFETDAARALLAYLVLNVAQPLRRETLTALLWPDQDDQDALHALSQTLNRLRRALDDANAQPPYLLVTRQTLQFNPDCVSWLDVTAFNVALDAVQRHPHRRASACRACLRRMEAAAQLYRGDLLEGFTLDSLPFEEWLLMQRETLHRRALTLFYDLADLHLARGDYAQAQVYARRQIALEAWREEAHGQLMRALALSGERSAALAQYAALRRILDAELGVEPADALQCLHAHIREESLPIPPVPLHHVPAYLTPFLGRDAELAQIAEQLNHPNARLLSLVGPGGVGKTRLACQVAENERGNFRDGVVFIPLAAVASAEGLAVALARALDFEFYQRQDLWTQLQNYLRHKEILLVLDNFEHLLPAASHLADLLCCAPALRLFVTTRECLRLQGEQVVKVGGLAYPATSPASDGESSDAVQFFIAAARRLRPDLAPTSADAQAIISIAQQVGGLPLALELAAAWTPTLSCANIAAALQRDFDFLADSLQAIPEAHRSLRVVFDSSWALLAPEEQAVAQALAVFPDSFDSAAAAQIASVAPPLLRKLVDKSLLRQEPGEVAPRYALHELIRRYAEEKASTAPQWEALRAQHSDYYLAWLAQQQPLLESVAARSALAAIDRDIGNVRAAWQVALTCGHAASLGGALRSLFLFYDKRAELEEGEAAFAAAAQVFAAAETPEARRVGAHALACQGWFALQHGRPAESQTWFEQSHAALQALDAPLETALALGGLGEVALRQGKYADAQAWYSQAGALYHESGALYGEAHTCNALGRIAYSQTQYAAAREQTEAGLTLARAAQLADVVADSLRQLGNIAFFTNDYDAAFRYYQQVLAAYQTLGCRWGESAALSNVGAVFARQGRRDQAREAIERCLHLKREIGDRWGEANALSNLAVLFNEQGALSRARTYTMQALALWRELHCPSGEAKALHNLASTQVCLGDYAAAEHSLAHALQIRRETHNRAGESRTLGLWGILAVRQGQSAQALEYTQAALALARDLGEEVLQAYALANQGGALLAAGQVATAAAAYREALQLRRSQSEPYLALDPLAGLARVAFAAGDVAQAQGYVDEILDFLAAHSLEGTDDPFEIYLTCVDVLQASGDDRATTILAEAVQRLQAQAAALAAPEQRRVFLDIATHRALLQRQC